jgi:peptide/nickel transport system substrate-binding protein
VLKVATIGEPPSLDPHSSPSFVTSIPMWHVFEALFTWDRDFNPIPLLAEGYALADGGRRYTITLRKGVRFHNGKALTAADVVASLKRWVAIAEAGRSLWKLMRGVDAKGFQPLDRLRCESPASSRAWTSESPPLCSTS